MHLQHATTAGETPPCACVLSLLVSCCLQSPHCCLPKLQYSCNAGRNTTTLTPSLIATGGLADTPLGAGIAAGEGCTRSAAALLRRLRPLAVLVEVHEKAHERSRITPEQVGAGPRYAMHSLVREIAAGMLASRSGVEQSTVNVLFSSYMLSRGETLASMEMSPSSFAPAQRLLSNELANFGGLVHVLEQLDSGQTYLDSACIGRCEHLASALVKRGYLQPAVGLLRVALRACEGSLGLDDVLTHAVTARLADTLGRCQQLDEADQLGQRVLSAREKLLGAKHPDTIDARAILALIRLQRGQVAEALMMQRAVVVSSEDVLGHFHIDTYYAHGKTAIMLAGDGQLEEAERMLVRVLEAQEAMEGPKHLHTVKTCAVLADVMSHSGRPEEALLLQCRVLWTRMEVLGPGHMDTREIWYDSAVAFSSDHGEAQLSMLSLLTEALEPSTLTALESKPGSAVLDTVLNAQWMALDTLRERVGAQGPDSTTTAFALAVLAALIVSPHRSRLATGTGHSDACEAALGPAQMSAFGASRSLGSVLAACRQRWGPEVIYLGYGWDSCSRGAGEQRVGEYAADTDAGEARTGILPRTQATTASAACRKVCTGRLPD